MAVIQFNAQQVQPQQPFEPVPENWYPAVIKESEAKASQGNPANGLLAFGLEIIDGPMKGRKLFDNLNMWYTVGANAEMVTRIAAAQLSAYCHVTGKYVITDTAELHNIPFQVKVIVVGNKNEIKGLKDMQGNDPGKQGQVAPGAHPAGPGMAPPPQQQAAAPAPAWGAAPQTQQQPPASAPAWGAPAGGSAPAPAWGAAAPAAQQAQAPAPAWGAAPAAGGGTPAWGR